MANKDEAIELRGPGSVEQLGLKSARISEGLSQLTETRIEFIAKSKTLDLATVVGQSFTIELGSKEEDPQLFSGVCISAENIGNHAGNGLYVAEVRPWLWFLTRGQNSRIFQEMSTPDIIKEVLGAYGFASDIDDKLSDSYAARTYCVQYRESDFDFICRLMEEEGIYYFFRPDGDTEKMVLADGAAAHSTIIGNSKIRHAPDTERSADTTDRIYDWRLVERVTPGKVTLNDYDFRQPKADQKKIKAIPRGKHRYKDYEIYDYPAHMRDMKNGDELARVMMEANAARFQVWHGQCNIRNLRVGQTFTLTDHPTKLQNQDYLFIAATHELRSAAEAESTKQERYECSFNVMPAEEQYRAPQVTPWPEIPGLQTAIVTGPSGDEIYTDEYGRIKVRFHWDRMNPDDETSSCWVRTVMPWTGKNWGMIAIPRIGQEVVIQFEEGDPDRPICTGMLYNADTMPPYELPANKTMTGMTTRSTTGGSTNTHHELVFEDKIGGEYVRFQSERDYHQIVKNNALIHIGGGHESPGDLTQTVKRNKTELVGEVRTHMVGLLEDLTVGLVYDETVGVSKTQTIGMYKEETVGLTLPDIENLAQDLLSLVVTVGGPISTLAAGGAYADLGAAATGLSGLAGALDPGKKEKINGVYETLVTGDRTERIKKSVFPARGKPGDMKLFVEDGNQIISVLKGDRQIGVEKGDLITGVDEGDYRVTVAEKNHLTSVLKGDMQVGVEKGDRIVGVDTGDQTTTIKSGDFKVKASAGKVKIEAMREIELKVGPSVIKISPQGIDIKGPMIKSAATGLYKAEGAMTTISGDMTMIDGSMVLIN